MRPCNASRGKERVLLDRIGRRAIGDGLGEPHCHLAASQFDILTPLSGSSWPQNLYMPVTRSRPGAVPAVRGAAARGGRCPTRRRGRAVRPEAARELLGRPSLATSTSSPALRANSRATAPSTPASASVTASMCSPPMSPFARASPSAGTFSTVSFRDMHAWPSDSTTCSTGRCPSRARATAPRSTRRLSCRRLRTRLAPSPHASTRRSPRSAGTERRARAPRGTQPQDSSRPAPAHLPDARTSLPASRGSGSNSS